MDQPQIDPSVVTTRNSLDPALTTIDKLCQTHPDISFIRFQWQDYSGVLRAKIFVIKACLALAADNKFLRGPPVAFHCIMDSTVFPGTNPSGVHWLVPDWSSLQLSTSPGTAIVMCGVIATTPSNPIPNGDLCPRQALVKVVRQAAESWQLDFLVGFEVEFQVMKPSGRHEEGMVPYSCGLGHFAVVGLLDPCWSYVEECVQQLEALGVHVDGLHPEGQRGQYEITLGPLPPLQAVDQLVLVHSVLKRTFARHGCMVTMSPKPVAAAPETNGQHMHLSMQPARPDKEDFFLAGLLKRLPNLWAFFLPQKASYERVAPFMAGDFIGWGTENRVVPIRKIKSSHWEVRSTDATANMYLTLAAVLSAGLLGLAGSEPLNWPDMAVEEMRTPVDPLPRSLEDSLSVLGGDFGGLDTLLGKNMIQHYVELKRYELSQVNRMAPNTARDLLTEVF